LAIKKLALPILGGSTAEKSGDKKTQQRANALSERREGGEKNKNGRGTLPPSFLKRKTIKHSKETMRKGDMLKPKGG